MSSKVGNAVQSNHVRGLDGWRFWCALWVVFGHFGFVPLIDGVDLTSALGRVTRAVYDNLVSAPAAVIVFFVISGFCVHYPYRAAAAVKPIAPFFARRYLRTLIPVAIAIAISGPLGVRLVQLDKTILWSLYCEEIYYGIYPLLLKMRAKWGWRRMIAVAYATSFALALTNLKGGDYASYGVQANWLLGLPCWLLGCDLAESYDGLVIAAQPSRVPLTYWRVGALALSMVASVLRFHSAITYPVTLNMFAVYVYFWLREELVTNRAAPVGWAARAGAFSYSLYLIHPAAHEVWQRFHVPSLGTGVMWLLFTAFTLALAYGFYLVVERPAHRLSRRIYGWMVGGRRLPTSRPALLG